jgi:hypothetical protein
MQSTHYPTTTADERTPVARQAARARHLNRLIDSFAATEAVAALNAAAMQSRENRQLLPILGAAGALLAGSAEDFAHESLQAAVLSADFLPLLKTAVRELRAFAAVHPENGSCTVATALELWSWTAQYLRDANGGIPISAIPELVEALAPLLAARSFAFDTETAGRRDLAFVYAASAAATAGAVCAELVFGFRRHLVWDAEGCATCYSENELEALQGFIPGIESGAGTTPDVVRADGSHPAKQGPCARFDGLDTFMKLRRRLDACLTGARLSKDRVVAAMSRPESNA